VQVFLEPDEPKVLPVPYWTDGEPDRRFWNLKREPALATRVAELEGCDELREFVLRVNGPESRFATLGCAHWIKPSEHPAFRHEAGLYADLVPDRFEAAERKRWAIDFVERLTERGSRVKDGTTPTIIRLQPQRVAFTALGPRTAWLLSTWVFGAGATEHEAVAARRRGLAEVAALCQLASVETAARDGDAGTPVPP
jgi:hypothetical protein